MGVKRTAAVRTLRCYTSSTSSSSTALTMLYRCNSYWETRRISTSFVHSLMRSACPNCDGRRIARISAKPVAFARHSVHRLSGIKWWYWRIEVGSRSPQRFDIPGRYRPSRHRWFGTDWLSWCKNGRLLDDGWACLDIVFSHRLSMTELHGPQLGLRICSAPPFGLRWRELLGMTSRIRERLMQ